MSGIPEHHVYPIHTLDIGACDVSHVNLCWNQVKKIPPRSNSQQVAQWSILPLPNVPFVSDARPFSLHRHCCQYWINTKMTENYTIFIPNFFSKSFIIHSKTGYFQWKIIPIPWSNQKCLGNDGRHERQLINKRNESHIERAAIAERFYKRPGHTVIHKCSTKMLHALCAIHRACLSTAFHVSRFGATFMYHGVTRPFIGAFRYRGTLKKWIVGTKTINLL